MTERLSLSYLINNVVMGGFLDGPVAGTPSNLPLQGT